MAAIAALILFVLAAFGVHWDGVDMVPLGLACVALHLLIGNWPLGTIQLTRRPGS